jgi:hypothetical protein
MISQREAQVILKREVEPDIVLPKSYIGNNRYVYVPTHTEYYSDFKSGDHYYVFVHPGFLANSFLTENVYSIYFNNLKWLINNLRRLNEPIMLVLEENVLLGKRKIDETFYPQKHELLLLTNFCDPKLSEYIDTQYERVKIDLEALLPFFKKIGVKEFRFAGELGGGCVKGVAEVFYKKFRVRGIRSCIYPVNPIRKDDKLLEMLYDEVFIPNF